MRAHFDRRDFSIEEAELFALTETGFRETHVRPLVLLPAYDAGALAITETTAKRKRVFPPGTRMRFVS